MSKYGCRKTKNDLGELVRYKNDSVPNRLKVNPFFLKVLAFDAPDMFRFCLDSLSEFGYDSINFFSHPEQGYIFARGELPVCLCAHLDKVPHYKHIEKISKKVVCNANGKVIDVVLSSAQGIGGDDRCGVYAILSMLKLGHRPSVFFCMGEEIGCQGSRKFTQDFPADFLDGVNAFIQIDRRGNKDVVRYSDDNDALTNAIKPFGFEYAWGTCTDISVLMPHFGISGVNLSSGYYNEHHASYEYVSVKDVNSLLKRLNKILGSDIFLSRYVYKARSYSSYFSYYDTYRSVSVRDSHESAHPGSGCSSRFNSRKEYHQMSLLDDYPYEGELLDGCDWCGEMGYAEDLIEVQDEFMDHVCPSCADSLVHSGEFLRCPCCKKLFRPTKKEHDPGFLVETCPFCGGVIEND